MIPQETGVSTPMPKYRSHKEVWALKIKAVRPSVDGSAIIVPQDQGFDIFSVTPEYFTKHKPEAGGYFVQYEDGYCSFSPAKAFEEGYTRI